MPRRTRWTTDRVAPERWSGAPTYLARAGSGWQRHLTRIAGTTGGGFPATATAPAANGTGPLTDLLRD